MTFFACSTKNFNEVKLSEFGQPKPAESPIKIRKQKIIKSEENQTISQCFWLKSALWFGFSFTLTLELAFFLYTEKQHKQKRKLQFEATWKNPFLRVLQNFESVVMKCSNKASKYLRKNIY